MLPAPYPQAYNAFQRSLQQLQQAAETVDRPQLQAAFQTAQQIFQQQIIPLEAISLETEAIVPTTAVRIRSIQVEINKQLRLLATDLLFLQAARLSATASQRQQQICDRIELLLRYCEAVIEKDEG
jgi:hypothetical protein